MVCMPPCKGDLGETVWFPTFTCNISGTSRNTKLPSACPASYTQVCTNDWRADILDMGRELIHLEPSEDSPGNFQCFSEKCRAGTWFYILYHNSGLGENRGWAGDWTHLSRPSEERDRDEERMLEAIVGQRVCRMRSSWAPELRWGQELWSQWALEAG